MQTAINAASGLLPKNLPNPPTYRKTNPANALVLIYAIHSDAYPIQDLDQYANTLLAQSLSRINGVGQVIIAGKQQPAVDVRLNPTRSRPWASVSRRSQAPFKARASISRKAISRVSARNCPLDTNDQLTDAAQFRHVIVAYRNGAPVELRDIATASIARSATAPAPGTARSSGVLLIERAPGANTIDVVDRIKAALPSSSSRSRARSTSTWSPTARRRSAPRSPTWNSRSLLTIALVVMVIFLFLRSSGRR